MDDARRVGRYRAVLRQTLGELVQTLLTIHGQDDFFHARATQVDRGQRWVVAPAQDDARSLIERVLCVTFVCRGLRQAEIVKERRRKGQIVHAVDDALNAIDRHDRLSFQG